MLQPSRLVSTVLLGLFCFLNLLWGDSPAGAETRVAERPIDWEQVSLDVLANQVRLAASEQKLDHFEISSEDKAIQIIYRDISFLPNSPELTPETKDKLSRLAVVLKPFQTMGIKVEGHTAKVVGEADDGSVLSGQRAAAVGQELLASKLFPPENVITAGRGETVPIAPNDTEEGRAKNRRVEISIVDKNTLTNPTSGVSSTAAATPIYVTDGKPLWWGVFDSGQNPGAVVFVIPEAGVDETSLQAAVARENRSDVQLVHAEGAYLLTFTGASYKPATDIPDPQTAQVLTDLAKLSGPGAVARVGGASGAQTEAQAQARDTNVGRFLAYSSDLKPERVLVGDPPRSFQTKADPSAPSPSRWLGPLVESIDLTGDAALPWGRYAEFAQFGYGGGAGINFRIPGFTSNRFLAPLRLGLRGDVFDDVPNATSSVTSLWSVGWTLDLGYRLDWGWLIVTPRLGYGGIVNVLTDYRQDVGPANGITYYDQTAEAKIDFEFRPFGVQEPNVAIILVPGYRMFFEDDYFGYTATGQLGLRLNF